MLFLHLIVSEMKIIVSLRTVQLIIMLKLVRVVFSRSFGCKP